MSLAEVLTNWKTVVSNSAQFRTLVGAATAADALPYIVSFACEDEDKPANDDVVMYADIQEGRKQRFGSTGAGIYTGTIRSAIDIKQEKVEDLQPSLSTLQEFRVYTEGLGATIVNQIEAYAISSGTLILDDIDVNVIYDEETKPDAAVWVIEIAAPFGPR
jgi:hypothetical protein